MSITMFTNRTLRDNILIPPSLRKLNTFVLLLVNQRCCFARRRCILWSLFPVPDRPSRFCDRYPFKFDLLLPYDTSSFNLLSFEYIGELVCPLSCIAAKSHVLTYDCYCHQDLMETMTTHWRGESYTISYRYLIIAQSPKCHLSSSSLITSVSITACRLQSDCDCDRAARNTLLTQSHVNWQPNTEILLI